jgi:hypothetical protein
MEKKAKSRIGQNEISAPWNCLIARTKMELIYITKAHYIQFSDKTIYSVKVIAGYNYKVVSASLWSDVSGSALFLLCIYILSLTHSWSWAIIENPPVVQLLKKSHKFMEPEGSLPCSQEPSICPYPEPE